MAPGSVIANIGVHGTKVVSAWRTFGTTTRLVTPMLLNGLWSHKIDPKLLMTHRFKLDAYETFGHAADARALKVIIEA